MQISFTNFLHLKISKFEVRDPGTLEKVYALQGIEVDVDAFSLLQYLKNEYTQKEILNSLESYVDNSVAFEDAEESVTHLHQIVLDIEKKVDLELPQESMQRITLFESDDDIAKYLPLGLNTEYDYDIQFSPRDLVLIGGRRGAGKSMTCANIAHNVFEQGRSAMYFTIEMDSRSILQRVCAIATGIPHARLRTKNLGVTEWEKGCRLVGQPFSRKVRKNYKNTNNTGISMNFTIVLQLIASFSRLSK